ncbi:hypothetical protein ACLESO_35580 [Pyxidicoccus sp. 3LG]
MGRGRIWMAVLVVATGCEGIDLEELVRQHPPLSRLQQEPVGVNCPHGGTSVRVGLDEDEDGALADSEVKTTEYVCASPIPGMLVRTQQLPPGEPCPHGGQRFRAGLDLNDNGELEDAEITRDVHGCSEPEVVTTRVSVASAEDTPCEEGGSSVEAGPDLNRNGTLEDPERRARVFVCLTPAAVRSFQTELPSTPECPAGSTQVSVGSDLDQDGDFSDDEVVASMRVCRPLQTFDGNYTVRDAADLAALQGISRIRGTLEVNVTSLTELDLSHLMMVEGSIFIRGNPHLTSLLLRGLRFVERDLFISGNPSLHTLAVGTSSTGPVWLGSDLGLINNARLISLDSLDAVVPSRNLFVTDNELLRVGGAFDYVHELSGDLILRNNPLLQAPPFVALKRLGGTLDITNNDAMATLAGPPLQSIGGDFILEGNDALLGVGLPDLQSIDGRFDVRDNASLSGMTSGITRLGALSVVDNPSLDSLGNFHALQSIDRELYIGGNEKLPTLTFLGPLQRADSLTVIGNPRLQSLAGLGYLQKLGTLHVHNNNEMTTLQGLAGLRELVDLRVSFNGKLTQLGLNGLTRVTSTFSIVENPVLPTCQATALAARTFARQPDISRNDDTATCD